jgi:hypothetical protein
MNMSIHPYSDKAFNDNDRPTTILSILIQTLIICGILTSTPARTDSVMALPGGGENIMVTFTEMDPATTFPLTYRGVTYTRVESGVTGTWTGIWANPNMPITRFVKAPMLAMTTPDDNSGEPANPISLQLDFDLPTQFFGFSLGFNDRMQVPDSSLLSDIGSVVLEFSNGRSQVFPLSASRVLCCTESRFDYSDTDDSIVGNGLVDSATITLDYNYEPFFPGSGFPGDYFELKFMGIDDVTYSTAVIPTPGEVSIDIRPNKEVNVINLKSGDSVHVAILTEVEFYALDVNVETVKFGPNLVAADRYKVKDVDHDGDDDLLLYFNIQETGIACSDASATLTGHLYDESQIIGTDSIVTKGCNE